jgi:hypothetical protein
MITCICKVDVSVCANRQADHVSRSSCLAVATGEVPLYWPAVRVQHLYGSEAVT